MHAAEEEQPQPRQKVPKVSEIVTTTRYKNKTKKHNKKHAQESLAISIS